MQSATRFTRALLAFMVGVLSMFAAAAGDAATTYFPGVGEFGTLMFEDSWPSGSDEDHNDVVVRWNLAVSQNGLGDTEQLTYTLSVPALGSTTANGLALRLPVPAATPYQAFINTGLGPVPVLPGVGESQAVLWLVDDLRALLYPGQPGLINTDPAVSPVPVAPPMMLQIQFVTPVTLNVPAEPFDLFLHRSGDHSHQIHLPQYYGTDVVNPLLFGTGDDASDPAPPAGSRWYVDDFGLPWAINIPEDTSHPNYPGLAAIPSERTPIADAYPDFLLFAASGGTQATDWYLNPVVENLYAAAAVPEPATFILGLLGLSGLCLVGWRRRRRS